MTAAALGVGLHGARTGAGCCRVSISQTEITTIQVIDMTQRSRRRTFDDYPVGARKLISTAERLFGERGIEGVSLRQIILRSNQANNSAIQHHFGTKAGLVQAVYEMRLTKLEVARQQRLQKMSRKQWKEARTVLVAVLGPILDVMSEAEQESYAMFMLRMTHRIQRMDLRELTAHLCPASMELQRLLRKCFPKLPDDVFTVRWRLAIDVFMGGIAERRRLRAAGRFVESRAVRFWDDILGMALNVLQAPYPPRHH
jgi:AcrR family transcriptional regulator